MKIKIRRIDKELPLPKYETSGAVGFDLLAREDTLIKAKSIGLIPGNVIVETPIGFMLKIALRSSTPKRKGLMSPHGVGVVDQDYCGNEDEIKIQVYNFTNQDVLVEKGERIAQGVFVKIDKFDWEEVDEMSKKTRGGFGSTS
ncbi:dUTP diphosphatase [Candidatus Woesearchaeota archaeon]|nr:dUTP diphosphatase [Candidatus Woesearchaeota archaeon]